MTNTEAKLIHGLIKKENRVKAVEISGFINMLHQEGKCNEDMVKDVEEYVGILSKLYAKFDKLSVYHVQKKPNPIDPEDFARFTKFHVEITEFMKAAKEQLN
ncbi:hypothetical protein [Chryseobacterium sp.]|uniref:hypothetical protein n=1 Tax=Chryseobacterium sp. TaxID=1871047 RepID=UPI003219FBA1